MTSTRRSPLSADSWVLIGLALFVVSRVAIEVNRYGQGDDEFRWTLMWAQIITVLGSVALISLYLWLLARPSRIRLRELRARHPDAFIAEVALVADSAAVLRELGARVPVVGPNSMTPYLTLCVADGSLTIWRGRKELEAVWSIPTSDIVKVETGSVARLWLSVPALELTLRTDSGIEELPLCLDKHRWFGLFRMSEQETEDAATRIRAALTSARP